MAALAITLTQTRGLQTSGRRHRAGVCLFSLTYNTPGGTAKLV